MEDESSFDSTSTQSDISPGEKTLLQQRKFNAHISLLFNWRKLFLFSKDVKKEIELNMHQSTFNERESRKDSIRGLDGTKSDRHEKQEKMIEGQRWSDVVSIDIHLNNAWFASNGVEFLLRSGNGFGQVSLSIRGNDERLIVDRLRKSDQGGIQQHWKNSVVRCIHRWMA